MSLIVGKLHRRDALLQPLEHSEEGGHDEHLEQRSKKHTAHGSRTKGLVSVLTYSRGEHQRQQTDNHRQRRHKDRTQTGCGSEDGRILDSHTHLTALKGKLHNKDGVLCQQTDKHDERNLHVDVVVVSEDLCKDKRSGKSERNRENYRQWQDIALILCREDKIYEHDTHHEDDGCGVARLTLRTCQTRVVDTISLWQYLSGNLLDGADGVTRRITCGCRRIDVDGSEEVETVNVRRTIYTAQRAELLDRRHTARRAYIYIIKARDILATLNVTLDHHSIELTIGIHVGCIQTAIVSLESGEY